jgi:hypothetical protein
MGVAAIMVAVITVAAIAIRIINIAAEVPIMAVAASIVAASIAAARWREAVYIVVRRYAAVVFAARMLPTAAVAVDAGKTSQHVAIAQSHYKEYQVSLSILF